jgi:adenylate kinase
MAKAPVRYPAALIFGAPGAGKGTQGEILTRIPGFFHLSTGVIFRKLDPQTEEARRIKEYCVKGELVPDELTISIFLNWLEARRAADKFKPKQQLLLLDGIPRTVNQCKLLERYIDVKQVLYFECLDLEIMVDRIRRRAVLEGRPDDASESVTRKRLEIYERDTTPVLNYYDPAIIKRIDSSGLPAEVLAGCLQHLIPILKENFVFE